MTGACQVLVTGMAFSWIGNTSATASCEQEISVHDGAFYKLLNAYERMGDSLPLLLQYQDIFLATPHMIQVLVTIYEDILKIQRIILRYFQQPH